MKKIGILLLILLVISGCTTKPSNENNYEIFNVVDTVSQQTVSIITYTDLEDNLYYKIIPSSLSMNTDSEFINSYPVNWMMIKNPSK